MKRLAAILALIWCVGNLVVAYWMITGFLAKTPQHEGIVAQASVLLGGLLVLVFSVLVARQSLRILAAPDEASGA